MRWWDFWPGHRPGEPERPTCLIRASRFIHRYERGRGGLPQPAPRAAPVRRAPRPRDADAVYWAPRPSSFDNKSVVSITISIARARTSAVYRRIGMETVNAPTTTPLAP